MHQRHPYNQCQHKRCLQRGSQKKGWALAMTGGSLCGYSTLMLDMKAHKSTCSYETVSVFSVVHMYIRYTMMYLYLLIKLIRPTK